MWLQHWPYHGFNFYGTEIAVLVLLSKNKFSKSFIGCGKSRHYAIRKVRMCSLNYDTTDSISSVAFNENQILWGGMKPCFQQNMHWIKIRPIRTT